MKVNLKRISGEFSDGYVLDKHTSSSVPKGYSAYGHPRYDTTRTPTGEALFQLKYRLDFDQVTPLAKAVVRNIVPRFPEIGFLVPAPASRTRSRQPVHEVAAQVARRMDVPFHDDLIENSPDAANAASLKDMDTRERRDKALAGRFLLGKAVIGKGSRNALVIDDLFDTGATMDAVCGLLASHEKVAGVYVAALTWK